MEYYVGQYLKDKHSGLVIKIQSILNEYDMSGIVIDCGQDDYPLGDFCDSWQTGYVGWQDVTKKYLSPLWKVMNE